MASSCMRPRTRSWTRDETGAIGLTACLTLPALLLLVGAAIDYARLSSLKADLQRAADAAAIAAARELGVSSAGDADRMAAIARSVVASLLGAKADGVALVVEAAPNAARNGVDVTVSQPFRASGLVTFTTGAKALSAAASARRIGSGKMCVLVLSGKKSDESEVLKLEGQSQINGQDCGVFTNSTSKEAVNSKDGAVLKADLICSAGGFKKAPDLAARYLGERRTDCPPVDNPLKDRPEPQAGPCSVLDAAGKAVKLVLAQSAVLLPGTYCGGIEIKGKNTIVTVLPVLGNNVVVIKDGLLKVDDEAKLYGRGVGFAFTGENASFEFTGRSMIDLHAPTDGPLAGILFYGSLTAPDWREYKITSDYARVLVGTIYLPRGFLSIDARNPVADQSAYTAIIVSRLSLKDSPKLVLNTNYHQTKVPVAKGISQMGSGIQLTR